MKRFVITIGREFGCNAGEVGRRLAAKLGVRFYNKELASEAAAIAHIDENLAVNSDRNAFEKEKLRFYVEEFGYGASKAFFTQEAVEAQAFVIRRIANTESCVMFGRCADYFLSEFDFTLNVFLYAPEEFRIRHISSAYALDEAKAKKLLTKIDRERHDYYKFITGKNRGDRHGRNLMIDMNMFSVDDAVDLIYEAAKKRFDFI
ncbi:MAG: cytidylate kinase-like family protein [Treponema sp.]|nr:cytidylate kinase-like family protein [Treponema sp.]